ncbi:MAG: hypothetical protein Q8Q84_27605 [Hydrogenophaga sp.]|uniref:hypothetical protein n=1 Tax=Hydrogenophaga sp. TaxID=1904254 RepID=UPI00271E8A3B|nr:hypothetical protein [Hydrogenophaga sp.]MDO9482334.1 hypothetical protein [Hydrogenophaga sp.]MDP3348515.1 hypothetical protein [Hydrogenophaga sp.]MDP3806914.1 hypothetical protein [Hydrogenophaga sp.]MDP3927101.1 hypothetical protein [Hydrogenophaga sp.]
MSDILNKLIYESSKKLGDYINNHKGKSNISYSDYVQNVRKERSKKIKEKRIIYLDTFVWKWLADYKQGKTHRFTGAQLAFVHAIEDARQSGVFLFPIGLTTFFELDAMTDPKTFESLATFVDELCLGYCLAPFSEVLQNELEKVLTGKIEEVIDPLDYLVSPIELLGIPDVDFINSAFVDDELACQKAFFDVVSQLSFADQLLIARESDDEKWDNSKQIDDLNRNKIIHQDKIINLNTGIFCELKGIIEACFLQSGKPLVESEVLLLAAIIMKFWQDNPEKKSLPAMRVLSGLHGLLRFEKNRKYKSGDLLDFMAAASALPIAEAMFTDSRLAILLREKTLGFNNFSDCQAINGPEDMSRYIFEKL